jgi:hypothetical protein
MRLFLVHGTEFRVVFSSAEGFGTEFRDFLFRGTAGIPSEITLCYVYSIFHGIIFCWEIPNPSCRIGPPGWKSIPGLLKRSTNTGSDGPVRQPYSYSVLSRHLAGILKETKTKRFLTTGGNSLMTTPITHLQLFAYLDNEPNCTKYYRYLRENKP